jgi:hypothetical protein
LEQKENYRQHLLPHVQLLRNAELALATSKKELQENFAQLEIEKYTHESFSFSI